jgi:hypothetical protein
MSISGHWDELTSSDAIDAIEEMSQPQLERLIQGIIDNNVDVDFSEVPFNMQNLMYNYEEMLKNREKIQQQEARAFMSWYRFAKSWQRLRCHYFISA